MVFTAAPCSPRGPGFLASVIGIVTDQDTSVGVSGPHGLTVRTEAFVRTLLEHGLGRETATACFRSMLARCDPIEDGTSWIRGIIERTPKLESRGLEVNTVHYLENLVCGYVLQNRHKVRTVPQSHHQVLVILNFLLEKGSATAYRVRRYPVMTLPRDLWGAELRNVI
jgi:hypothetical protein